MLGVSRTKSSAFSDWYARGWEYIVVSQSHEIVCNSSKVTIALPSVRQRSSLIACLSLQPPHPAAEGRLNFQTICFTLEEQVILFQSSLTYHCWHLWNWYCYQSRWLYDSRSSSPCYETSQRQQKSISWQDGDTLQMHVFIDCNCTSIEHNPVFIWIFNK